MRRVLFFILALSAFVKVYAADISFQFVTGNGTITVIPSDDEQEYFCTVISPDTWAMFEDHFGVDLEDIAWLGNVVCNVYNQNLFIGEYTFDNLEAGEYVVFAASASRDHAAYDIYLTGPATVEIIPVTVDNDITGLEQLTLMPQQNKSLHKGQILIGNYNLQGIPVR